MPTVATHILFNHGAQGDVVGGLARFHWKGALRQLLALALDSRRLGIGSGGVVAWDAGPLDVFSSSNHVGRSILNPSSLRDKARLYFLYGICGRLGILVHGIKMLTQPTFHPTLAPLGRNPV